MELCKKKDKEKVKTRKKWQRAGKKKLSLLTSMSLRKHCSTGQLPWKRRKWLPLNTTKHWNSSSSWSPIRKNNKNSTKINSLPKKIRNSYNFKWWLKLMMMTTTTPMVPKLFRQLRQRYHSEGKNQTKTQSAEVQRFQKLGIMSYRRKPTNMEAAVVIWTIHPHSDDHHTP